MEKSIKENLGDILSEESIVGETKNKKFKIPIRGIKEYQFVYGSNNKGVATGTGEEKRGDKIGSAGNLVVKREIKVQVIQKGTIYMKQK